MATRSIRIGSKWLIGHRRRFGIGRPHGNTPQRAVTDLIRRFAPHSSEPVFCELESAVLRYHSLDDRYSVKRQLELLKEQGILIRNNYGLSQYLLLAAMPLGRLSPTAFSALSAWRSKFGDWKRTESSPIARSHRVASSIPRDRLHLVSDSNWLQIIRTGWNRRQQQRRSENPFALRNHDLFAADLQLMAQIDPPRFARFAMRIPLTAPLVYFERMLIGLSQSEPPRERPKDLPDWEPAAFEDVHSLVLRLLESGLISPNLVDSICGIVRNRASEQWDLRITDLIAQVSVVGSGPRPLVAVRAGQELNPWESPRGFAVEVIHQLIARHAGLAVRYVPEICHAVDDSDQSVRVSAIGLCCSFTRWDLDLAIHLFLKACDHPDERILNGHYVPHFCGLVWRRAPEKIRSILLRMINSAIPDLAALGAYWITAIAYAARTHLDLLESCRWGTVPQRRGVAAALVDLTAIDLTREAALHDLPSLFDDEDESVSDKAAHVFNENRMVLSHQLGPSIALKFAKSQAFRRDPSDLLGPLEAADQNLLPFADAILAAVDVATGSMAALIGNIQNRQALAARTLPEVLLRLYQQAERPDAASIRAKCLNAWDKMLESQLADSTPLDRIDA